MPVIRLTIPYHLRQLAGISGELSIDVPPPVTISAVIDVLEARYPMLRGTIRDHTTKARRPFIRFFADNQDLTFEPPEAELPQSILTGAKPLMVVGAMAGG